ncbi:hypothetical protein C0Q70_02673 [Pomacea canaliculata]|uniref:Uncharacterized protein n=1 Tax=Pomacea canaliculata TaxID=400727 RepID=A0A2T7PQP4_POMCA|nr:hypothetical protein C0Q70_02673 [Pomacea canaliculata]
MTLLRPFPSRRRAKSRLLESGTRPRQLGRRGETTGNTQPAVYMADGADIHATLMCEKEVAPRPTARETLYTSPRGVSQSARA